jgi:hypothetical protein
MPLQKTNRKPLCNFLFILAPCEGIRAAAATNHYLLKNENSKSTISNFIFCFEIQKKSKLHINFFKGITHSPFLCQPILGQEAVLKGNANDANLRKNILTKIANS